MGDIKFEQVFKGNVNTLKGSILQYPKIETPEIERWIVTLPPMTNGEWHIHLVPEFFYVEQGVLYVVNELQDKTLRVTTLGKGDHGLTDCHVPQFIWNPDKKATVRVVAIYLGGQDILPTRKLGKKPSNKFLNELLTKPTLQKNLTEIKNEININQKS